MNYIPEVQIGMLFDAVWRWPTAGARTKSLTWRMLYATALPRGGSRGLSHLCERPPNGVDGWEIDKEPTLMSSPQEYPEEIWGIEDPRIIFVPKLTQDTWSPILLIFRGAPERRWPRGSATSLQSQSLDVSYLAQTAQSTPVILYLPECVDRATTADS